MKNTKTIKATFEGINYIITYSETENVLEFIDKNGGTIGFVKEKDGGLGVYVNGKYSKKMWKDHPSLKGFNPYFLLPKQMEIFMNWYLKKEDKN